MLILWHKKTDKRSNHGTCRFLGDMVISCFLKKYNSIALSTTRLHMWPSKVFNPKYPLFLALPHHEVLMKLMFAKMLQNEH